MEQQLADLPPSSLNPLPISKLIPGKPCLAKFSEDGVLYRAKVCSMPQDDLVQVMFVDYGNFEEKATADVMALPENLIKPGPATIEVKLSSQLRRQVKDAGLVGTRVDLLLEENNQTIAGRLIRKGKELFVEKLKLECVKEEEEFNEELKEDSEGFQSELAKDDGPGNTQQCPDQPNNSQCEEPKHETEVLLTYVEDVKNVWVSKVHDIPILDEIEQTLSSMEELVKLPSVEEGMLAIAMTEDDGTLGRVKVERDIAGGRVLVRFIDYGNVEEKSGDELYSVPDGLDQTPAAAFVVKVATNKPNDDSEVRALYDILEGGKLTVEMVNGAGTALLVDGKQVHPEEGGERDGNSGRFLDHERAERQVGAEIAVEMGVGPKTNERGEMGTHNTKRAGNLRSLPDRGTVMITHVESANNVWVVAQDQQAELDLVMEELATLRPTLGPVTDVKVENTVGAVFSEDGELYRGKVIDNSSTVLFIDFGNTEVKQAEEMLKLPEHLHEDKIAAFAMYLQVANGDEAGAREKLEELMDLEEVFVERSQDGEAMFFVDGLKINFGTKGEVSTASKESKCQEELVQNSDKTKKENLATMFHVKESKVSVQGEEIATVVANLVKVKEEVARDLEETRNSWITGCLRMLAGEESWGQQLKKEAIMKTGASPSCHVQGTTSMASSASLVEKLMSEDETAKGEILDQLLSMDVQQLACNPDSSQVVQAAVLAVKTHSERAPQLFSHFASHLPSLASHPHGYLPLLSAFDAADPKQQGQFTRWLEDESVLLNLLNSDCGAFVVCRLMGENSSVSLQVFLLHRFVIITNRNFFLIFK